MRTPRLLAPAAEELRVAMLWYEERRPGLGTEFLGAFDALLARVGETPPHFPPWPVNRRFRRAILSRFPYVVFFHLEDDVPVVVAGSHTSRRPGHWLDRIRTTAPPKGQESP